MALPHRALGKPIPGSFPAGEGGFSSTRDDLECLGLPHRNPLNAPRQPMQSFPATWCARTLSDSTPAAPGTGRKA